MRRALAALVWLAASVPAAAQASASFRLDEAVLNAGGCPLEGIHMASAGFRVSFGAIGDAVVFSSSPSFQAESGLVGRYLPPGEVQQLDFASNTLLAWDDERSAGTYSVYRDMVDSLPGPMGVCYAMELQTAALDETADPAPGTAWFYLVTARNRLGEEGTKGWSSNGIERPNAQPCP